MALKPPLEPGWFHAPHGGIDRAYLDPDPGYKGGPNGGLVKDWNKRAVRAAWLVSWLEHLFQNSNFSFVANYLNGPGDKNLLTSASRTEGHMWTPNFSNIAGLGWGIWPIYQGFADSPLQENVALPPDWAQTQNQRGVAAGKHIKDIVAKLPYDDTAGMVVYVDNEQGPLAGMLGYYRELYKEIQTDRHDGRPVLRAGVYIRSGYVNQLLNVVPDMFVWHIEGHEGYIPERVKGKPLPVPIDRRDDPATNKSDVQHFIYERYPLIQQQIAYWPVGRQATLYFNPRSREPPEWYTKSMIWSIGGKAKKGIDGWDFNVSFVRDPRYPVGGPRFACQGAGSILYSKWTRGQGTSVREAGSKEPLIQGVESETPLISIEGELYLIDSEGNIVSTAKRKSGQSTSVKRQNEWSASTAVVPKGEMRRIRAFSVAKTSIKETLLFFVDKRLQIQVYRRQIKDSKDTGKPVPFVPDGPANTGTATLHPFTTLTTSVFRSKVYLFFTQPIPNESTKATLTVAQFGSNTAPATLGPVLKGTSITAVAMTNYLLVFAIASDRQLYYSWAIEDKDSLVWKPLKLAGDPQFKVPCHPHSVLGSCMDDPTHVKVAVMTDEGTPVVYPFNLAGTEWGTGTAKDYLLDDEDRTDSPTGYRTASGWTFNPYGDVVLVKGAQGLELYVNGATPGRGGILMRRIDKKPEPWYRLDDEMD